jgi:E3 ubiquitin-protein ligase UBR4
VCLLEGSNNALLKQYYDLLWRILGYLPPSNEFVENMNTYGDTAHLLHLFRFEKKLIQDKHISDFLSKEISFKEIQWFKHIHEQTHSLFDLIVYQILFQNLSSTSEEINQLYKIFVNEFKTSLNTNEYMEALSSIPITKPIEDKTKSITIPTLPTDFEELFKFQLNFSLEQNDFYYIYLRQILQILSSINSEIDDKQLYIQIQLDINLQFLKEQIKLKNINNETINTDMCEYIYKNIFAILFNSNFPNEIITDEIYHDLIKYFDEQFQPITFQNCLAPHDLFDLLYLTSKPKLSVSIFARMLMLFNKIFSYSNQFQLLIQNLNRIADLTNEQLSQWLAKLVLPLSEEKNQLYTSEQCKHILETFTKYLIKKNDDGTNMIGEEVSLSILSVLIQLGNELLKPNKSAIGFSQIIQLLVILAGHGSGNGHTYLFQAAAIWLEFCADALTDNNKLLESLSAFDSNILEASVYLLAYINDILIALKHLSNNELLTLKSPVKSDESEDDDDDSQDDDDDDDNLTIDPKKSLLSSTIQTEYDPNKLCTYTTTKKEYANQHWYHCHTCKMIDRVGICQICANVCHKDHEISYAKYGSFFCDCGAKEDGSCQALIKRPNTTIIQPLQVTLSSKKKIIKKSTKSSSNKKLKLTNRQRRLVRQINSKQQEYHLCIQKKHIPSNTLRLFQLLQPYIEHEYQQIYNIENKFDLISEFLKSNNQNSIDNDENKQLYLNINHSQENAFEHVKLSFTNEHGPQIKQLLSTNSIRRQGMCIMSSLNPDQSKQQLIISQEKGKQAMITVVQLNSLLKQTTTTAAPVTNDNSAKKKFTINKLHTFNIPFTVLSMQPNQLNSDYLCITGLKDCHILNIDTNGRLKEPTIILQPNLDSTGNYIIKAQWLADKNQSQLALLTADFIKIYDLSIDSISPNYYFILPTGKKLR